MIPASKLLEVLEDGDLALVQLSRRDNEAGTAPDWNPPQEVRLFVQRREKAYKKFPIGALLLVAIAGGSWAEYTPPDYMGDGEFLAEEYRMCVLKLNGEEVQ